MVSGANPYAALKRVLRLKPAQQRRLLRLNVRCEQNKCTPVRVFAHRDGLLVQCRSDANVEEMREQHSHLSQWSRRRAFFLEEWFELPEEDRPDSHLQVVCDCLQTVPRLVDVRLLADAVPAKDAPTRNVSLPSIAARNL